MDAVQSLKVLAQRAGDRTFNSTAVRSCDLFVQGLRSKAKGGQKQRGSSTQP